MLNELQNRKNDLKNKSEENKNKRNELNLEASKWATKRNELNTRTKELIDEAQQLKKQRDENNEKVGEAKLKRDELNEQANKVYAEIDKIRKDLNLGDGPSLKEMKREIDQLEFKQQTEVLKTSQEREIVDRIAKLTDELKRKKTQLEGSSELKSLLENAQVLRDEAAKYHDQVKESAEAAQQHHDKMITIFKEADAIRAESDAAHKDFVKAQEAADEQHRLFIQSQKEIREINKLIIGLKRKTKETKDESIREQTKKEAEEVYNQFKLGEKLNTEDLMLLQRSGLL
ncbi:MAG: coiled-coil protein [Euryarchaeota archaeon]|nr:coiled-coil protein [Euryarchaeota archaeon]MBU4221239.1 coiled-coil protein [Euryarchaeota archaeon]MBU4339512.1 coiled-coil protein [Euryarchaeota archaeon]MBU4453971.1 coiled-coil protein [Euryarchaeota archaeon]MCG2736966.1 coiled-coil protein [Candidatus Methanoperedenaceae archaeon]